MDTLTESNKDFGGLTIRGGMEPEEIREVMDKFNNYKEHRVLNLQITATKYGLTLLGSPEAGRCHTTVYMENSFSLDDRLQSEDRNHRAGQTNPVLYVDLMCSQVDARAITALQTKRDVAQLVLDDIRQGKLKKV